MIYTELTRLAMEIAEKAHYGQKDKGGFPYVFHPYHIAEQMNDEYSICVALLHDTIEDSKITIDYLRSLFPQEVCAAVLSLTRRSEETYNEYIERVKTNSIAKKVKIADLKHNLDNSRKLNYSNNERKQIKNLSQRYLNALNSLYLSE